MTTPQPTDHTTPRPDDPDAADLAYVHELLTLEQDGAHSDLRIGPWSLWVLISSLQLTLRHPELSGTVRDTLADMIGQFRVPFNGTHGAALIDQGFSPVYDSPPRAASRPPRHVLRLERYPAKDAVLTIDGQPCRVVRLKVTPDVTDILYEAG